MTLVGNRGIQLYLECVDAFALMSRVRKYVRPFSILAEAETLWKFPGFISLIVSLLAICSGRYWCLLCVIPSSSIASFLLIRCEWAVSKILLPLKKLAAVYSVMTGHGIIVVLCVGLSYYMLGWRGILGYVACNLFRIVLDSRLELRTALKWIEAHEVSEPPIEIKCFLLAFAEYARKYGVDSSYAITQTELMAGEDLLAEFASEWPMIVHRFGTGEGTTLPRKE